MDKASKGRARAPAHSAGALPEERGDTRLLDVVKAEIIPRLMHAHPTQSKDPQGNAAIRPAQVEVFARSLLERSPESARALLAGHLENGVALESIYLNLFTAAAQLLGEWWESDYCNFSQVTLCLSRLQAMLYELSPSFQAGAGTARLDRSGERRILMTTLPGQQHTMGLSILSEFFRREGWVVLSIPSPEPGLTQATLSAHWFDVLALSASHDAEIGDLATTIQAARKTSQNPRMAIMVGGPLFLRRPELSLPLGADGMSHDARDALALAQHLLQCQREIRLN